VAALATPGGSRTRLSCLLVYAGAVATPAVLAAALHRGTGDGVALRGGLTCALLGFAVVAMQFVVSARLHWVERPFGLDRVYRFHKTMAVVATVLLLSHPLLLALGYRSWLLFVSLRLPWAVYVGKLSVVALLVTALVSLFRRALRLSFERWRVMHNAAGALALLGGFAHGLSIGRDLTVRPMQVVWAMLLGVALTAYVVHQGRRRRGPARGGFTVAEVKQETHNVWTVKLAPPPGTSIPEYLPGQFHFLTLYRDRGLPVEEHLFTIASSPTDNRFLVSTIKESGDFTATIGETKPGDKAVIDGPYGRFSYLLYPDEGELVFIAGGIGITPLMSMLRYMRDTRAEREVLLLYGNRTEADIVFREEIAAMEAGSHPRLKVVHVLQEPGGAWKGGTGIIDREKLEWLCGPNVAGKAYYVCGPAGMMTSVLRTLRELGAPKARLHSERFAL